MESFVNKTGWCSYTYNSKHTIRNYNNKGFYCSSHSVLNCKSTKEASQSSCELLNLVLFNCKIKKRPFHLDGLLIYYIYILGYSLRLWCDSTAILAPHWDGKVYQMFFTHLRSPFTSRDYMADYLPFCFNMTTPHIRRLLSQLIQMFVRRLTKWLLLFGLQYCLSLPNSRCTSLRLCHCRRCYSMFAG